MKEFEGILLKKKNGTPLYLQLGEALCRLIEQGVLSANSKLPPIREMASCLGVNNVTVVAAYKYLANKGVVYSQVGSGTFVSPIPVDKMPKPVLEKNMVSYEKTISIEETINFVNTSMPTYLFPTEAFKESFQQVLDREKGGAFQYIDSIGYEPLREILCSYLEESYGIHAKAECIQILSGAQQGIDIVSKAMMGYGDVIFVEKPTFYGAAGAFLSRGGKLIEIPLEQDGMDMEALENLLKLYHPKFIYVMAYFQTPTGISYSLQKKRHLLELAEKYDTYIIEDDNLYDFNYKDEKIVPLKALDYKNRVVYIKSFSKVLMPGLRIGFMVLPKKMMESATKAKYTTDISTSGFLQKAFHDYLKNNDWKEHTRMMCAYGKQKYETAIFYAKNYLQQQLQWNLPGGGISLWMKLPSGITSEQYCSMLLKENVIVSQGSQYDMSEESSQFIRLCFTNVSDERIEDGMKKMADVLQGFSLEYP